LLETITKMAKTCQNSFVAPPNLLLCMAHNLNAKESEKNVFLKLLVTEHYFLQSDTKILDQSIQTKEMRTVFYIRRQKQKLFCPGTFLLGRRIFFIYCVTVVA